MLKKLICALFAASMLLALVACGEQTSDEPKATTPVQTEFDPFVIAKDNIEKSVEKKSELGSYDGEAYSLINYNGKSYIAKALKSGNMQAVYEFTFDFTILDEANKRAGDQFIYFTRHGSNGEAAALCAYYIPTGIAMTVVDGPCSNFVLMNVPNDYEIYPYGFIVSKSDINVIDLKDGDLSAYSKSLEDVKLYFEAPDAFFLDGKGQAGYSTKLSAPDKEHILVEITETNRKGEVEEELKFTFNPILGVFVKN